MTLGLVLLVVPFLPACNIFFRVGFVIAERVLYLSSAGYCLLLAYALGHCCGRWSRCKVENIHTHTLAQLKATHHIYLRFSQMFLSPDLVFCWTLKRDGGFKTVRTELNQTGFTSLPSLHCPVVTDGPQSCVL